MSKELHERIAGLVRRGYKTGEVAWSYAGTDYYSDDLLEILGESGDEDLAEKYVDQLLFSAMHLLQAVKTGVTNGPEQRLQAFMYLLMRDKLPSADVVECVQRVEHDEASGLEMKFTAEGLAIYAEELAGRVLGG